MALLRPLLWACHNFRAVAYPRYCTRFYLDPTSSAPWGQWPNPFGLGYHTHQLAKDLCIELSERSIYSGKALDTLSQAPYEGQSFPLVRVLSIVIIVDDTSEDIELDSSAVEANIGALVQRIKEMAPMLSKVCVEVDNNEELLEITRRCFGSLVSQRFRLAAQIEYNDFGDIPVHVAWRLNDICYLSHIKSGYGSNVIQSSLLARQSVQTLKSLNIHVSSGFGVSILIENADGSHVTYPQLLTLRLLSSAESSEHRGPVFSSDAVPFPSLRSVNVPSLYPFGDDTLFRGNATTLECLTMRLDASTVTMFRRHNTFRAGSHPKLWHVNVPYDDGLIPGTFATAEESVLFALSIGPKASVRELSCAAPIENPANALVYLGNHTDIQILTLAQIRLEVWDVIALIKSLPLLSDLHSPYPHLEALPTGVTQDELPAYVCSRYAPVSKLFRCINLDENGYGIGTGFVLSVLLLALVCPSFGFAVLPRGVRIPFMGEMERTIASSTFKQYAPRLQRLLFHGWDRC
ncbi:hypothetical protein GGF42_004741 [Coemansia sp. RSA 2424]|nr:hypothetical protein GGF42_004741 [Coemansia sp. RSA 2424]